MIWGFRCDSIMDIDHAEGYEHHAIGKPHQFAFVLSQDEAGIKMPLPFVIFQDQSEAIAAVDPGFLLDDPVGAGLVKSLADPSNWEKFAINYFQPVLRALSLLACGSASLKDAPFTMLTRREHELRAEIAAPNNYKVLTMRRSKHGRR
jgi:hypothetical protein